MDLVNTDIARRWTALHQAASANDINAVNMLLRHGADPTKRNRDGHTPLDLTTNDEVRVVLLHSDVISNPVQYELGQLKQLLMITGYRGEKQLNTSMQKAIDLIRSGNKDTAVDFDYNLSGQSGLAGTAHVTPIVYLKTVLPTYKYNDVRDHADKLLAILDSL